MDKRIEFFSDSQCKTKIDSPDNAITKFAYQAFSQHTCNKIDGSKASVFSECGIDTFSLNFAFDCGSKDRLEKN